MTTGTNPTLTLLDGAISNLRRYLDESASELSILVQRLDALRANRSAAADDLDAYLTARKTLAEETTR